MDAPEDSGNINNVNVQEDDKTSAEEEHRKASDVKQNQDRCGSKVNKVITVFENMEGVLLVPTFQGATGEKDNFEEHKEPTNPRHLYDPKESLAQHQKDSPYEERHGTA